MNPDMREHATSARLFAPSSINGMELHNRFVRSATWEGLADDHGQVTDQLTEKMVELAHGEVGLIITGYAFVRPEGQSSPRQMAIYDDRFLPGLHRMAQAVHAAGGKIALQLVHGGCHANGALTGVEPVGPSVRQQNGLALCRMADKAEIDASVAAFAESAGRAKAAGFDAVQIHAAHGFLLSQFLSPAFNSRTDAYGGSLANRARFLLEVVARIRGTVGPDYPVLVKLNSDDFMDNGLSRAEALEVARLLEQASVDAIEFSGGTVASPPELMPPRPGRLKSREQEAYYRQAAAQYKQKIAIPLILVGGIRSLEVAETLIAEGVTDYISLSRPLICEPDLIKRWHAGDRRPSECVSDNACFGPPSEGNGFYCVTFAKKRGRAEQ